MQGKGKGSVRAGKGKGSVRAYDQGWGKERGQSEHMIKDVIDDI